MKNFFLLILLFPVIGLAQGNNKNTTLKNQTKETVSEGFVIKGEVTGFPDGTAVALLNGQTGAPESESEIKNNKFEFKGTLQNPDFKIILFDKQPPFITLFLDNSNVQVKADKATIHKPKVTGSKSHEDFEQFNNSLEPYQAVFMENVDYDSAAVAKAMSILVDFVTKHKDSYITPLAVIRYNQIAEDVTKTEVLFDGLAPALKASALGQYIAQQIKEGKSNGIGAILADFQQADTAGNMLSLSSLRGKYVLVDFWASWCGPCRQENPNLVMSYNKYKNKNFTVLGVSLDKTKSAWIQAIMADNLTWPHVSDLQGWNNAAAQQFQIFSIPQNFLVDPTGKVIGKNLRGPALEKKLARVLN